MLQLFKKRKWLAQYQMNVNNNKRAVQQQPAATTAAGGSSSGGGAGAPLNAVEHNHHQVVTVTAATPNSGSDRSVELQYADTKVIGNGSFGVVYLAKLVQTNEDVAIKKVLQDKRFKNRELQIMRRLDHRNVVKLKYFFYTNGEKKDEVYLNLILEYVPETVYRVARHYAKQRQIIPILYIKIYMYQLFRALAYIHSIGICHRDIKPQNLLLNAQTSVLKLCDFGSAKILTPGEPNVAYICSRYYRAPELIFGATDYTTKIDVWSAGTVLAELLLGQPFFPGDSGVDQLVEIIKVLGTPTREEIQMMNPNYTEFRFPMIRPHPWQRVFRARTPQEAVDLVSQLLRYTPTARLSPLEAMAHEFFDELRSPSCKLPSANPMPVLFDFSDHELSIEPHLNGKLIPPHLQPLRCCPTTSGGGLEANTQSAKSTTSTTETSDAQESGSRNEPTSATAAAASSSVSNANNESVKQSGTTPTNATSAPNVSASGTTTGCGGGSTGSSSAAPGGGGAPAASSGGASTAAVAAGGSDKDH